MRTIYAYRVKSITIANLIKAATHNIPLVASKYSKRVLHVEFAEGYEPHASLEELNSDWKSHLASPSPMEYVVGTNSENFRIFTSRVSSEFNKLETIPLVSNKTIIPASISIDLFASTFLPEVVSPTMFDIDKFMHNIDFPVRAARDFIRITGAYDSVSTSKSFPTSSQLQKYELYFIVNDPIVKVQTGVDISGLGEMLAKSAHTMDLGKETLDNLSYPALCDLVRQYGKLERIEPLFPVEEYKDAGILTRPELLTAAYNLFTSKGINYESKDGGRDIITTPSAQLYLSICKAIGIQFGEACADTSKALLPLLRRRCLYVLAQKLEVYDFHFLELQDLEYSVHLSLIEYNKQNKDLPCTLEGIVESIYCDIAVYKGFTIPVNHIVTMCTRTSFISLNKNDESDEVSLVCDTEDEDGDIDWEGFDRADAITYLVSRKELTKVKAKRMTNVELKALLDLCEAEDEDDLSEDDSDYNEAPEDWEEETLDNKGIKELIARTNEGDEYSISELRTLLSTYYLYPKRVITTLSYTMMLDIWEDFFEKKKRPTLSRIDLIDFIIQYGMDFQLKDTTTYKELYAYVADYIEGELLDRETLCKVAVNRKLIAAEDTFLLSYKTLNDLVNSSTISLCPPKEGTTIVIKDLVQVDPSDMLITRLYLIVRLFNERTQDRVLCMNNDGTFTCTYKTTKLLKDFCLITNLKSEVTFELRVTGTAETLEIVDVVGLGTISCIRNYVKSCTDKYLWNDEIIECLQLILA